MKTQFPNAFFHKPQYYLIDASGKTLGRLSTEISKLLRGKEKSFYTPGVDQGNFVALINADKILVSGKKESQKIYYRNSQRPGSLKSETFMDLKKRFPIKILETAIWGMLPKGSLGRIQYRRLYIFSNNELVYKKNKNISQFNNINWIKKDNI